MHLISGRMALTALALLLFGAVGSCGGNGDPSTTPNPSATREPPAPPTVVGSTVIFPAKGYQLEIPSGWSFEENAVRSQEIEPDFLIHPETVDGVQANIVVSCERLVGEARTITLDQFFENKASRAQRLGATGLTRLDQITVAGVHAEVLQYERAVGEIAAVRQDVLFIDGDCAWQLAFTAAKSTLERFKPDFEFMLRSFSLIERDE